MIGLGHLDHLDHPVKGHSTRWMGSQTGERSIRILPSGGLARWAAEAFLAQKRPSAADSGASAAGPKYHYDLDHLLRQFTIINRRDAEFAELRNLPACQPLKRRALHLSNSRLRPFVLRVLCASVVRSASAVYCWSISAKLCLGPAKQERPTWPIRLASA